MPVPSLYWTSAWYVCLQKKQWISSVCMRRAKILGCAVLDWLPDSQRGAWRFFKVEYSSM